MSAKSDIERMKRMQHSASVQTRSRRAGVSTSSSRRRRWPPRGTQHSPRAIGQRSESCAAWQEPGERGRRSGGERAKSAAVVQALNQLSIIVNLYTSVTQDIHPTRAHPCGLQRGSQLVVVLDKELLARVGVCRDVARSKRPFATQSFASASSRAASSRSRTPVAFLSASFAAWAPAPSFSLHEHAHPHVNHPPTATSHQPLPHLCQPTSRVSTLQIDLVSCVGLRRALLTTPVLSQLSLHALTPPCGSSSCPQGWTRSPSPCSS